MKNLLISKNVLLSLLLLGSFALSGWLIHLSLQSETNSPNHPTTPDGFMTEAHFTQFNRQGDWQNSFYAPQVRHYRYKNSAELMEPRIISQGSDQLKWIITAQSGFSENDGAVVYLKDNVQITRLNEATQKTTILKTVAMTAYPRRQYLTTDQPVTITELGSIIHSQGLTADLNTGDISLLANVRGTYQSS